MSEYPKFSDAGKHPSMKLTFAGFLAVRLMEFDYAGKHYSYHGAKLKNALQRLTMPDGGPSLPSGTKPSPAELVVWGQAVYDWKKFHEARIESK